MNEVRYGFYLKVYNELCESLQFSKIRDHSGGPAFSLNYEWGTDTRSSYGSNHDYLPPTWTT